ncbi:MAG: zinc ribbon domain-containing protein [Candidatus Hodarchaeales archaeon]|jgi:hypothetical protein
MGIKCDQCGNEVEENRQICPQCGYKIQIIILPPLESVITLQQIISILILSYVIYGIGPAIRWFTDWNLFTWFLGSFLMSSFCIGTLFYLTNKFNRETIEGFFPQNQEFFIITSSMIWMLEIVIMTTIEMDLQQLQDELQSTSIKIIYITLELIVGFLTGRIISYEIMKKIKLGKKIPI